MKKWFLLASLLAAVSALTGCGPHPNDITDEVATVTVVPAQA